MDNIVSRKHAMLFTYPKIEFTDTLPPIFHIFKDFLFDEKGQKKEDGLRILMKVASYEPCEDHKEDTDHFLENESGFLYEYNRVGRREDVRSVFIEDDVYCGNYIIGSLLTQAYPNLETVLIDRYRGWSWNLFEGEQLAIKNLIALGSQGRDNPFDYIRKLPSLEAALFDEYDDIYFETYSEKNTFDRKFIRTFKEEFEDCLKITKNLKTLMIFHRYNADYHSSIPIHEPVLYEPPDGWSVRLIQYPGKQIYYWICYDKATLSLLAC